MTVWRIGSNWGSLNVLDIFKTYNIAFVGEEVEEKVGDIEVGDIGCITNGKMIMAVGKITGLRPLNYFIGNRANDFDNVNAICFEKLYFNEDFPDIDFKIYDGQGKQLHKAGVLYKQQILTSYNLIKRMNTLNDTINLIKYKKQIILQGPPGTGKTRMAKEIAEKIIFGNVSDVIKQQEQRLGETNMFKIIQFHPSYSYEDFVRGISTKVHDGSVFYETQDKVLLEFIAINESENIIYNYRQYLNEYVGFLRAKIGILPMDVELNLNLNGNGLANITSLDEFNEEIINNNGGIRYGNGNSRLWYNQVLILINHFHVFENFANHEFANWLSENAINLGIADHVDDNASAYFVFLRKFNNYIQTYKRYVLVIDEINRANLSSVLGELIYGLEYRNNKIASPYSIDGSSEFNIPDNLLIIGTMNTADRSVGHIDYAIRRRFAFVDVLPTIEPIREAGREFFKEVAALFIEDINELDNMQTAKLKPSQYMATDFKPEEVMIGHSYFITKENDENGLTEEQQIKMKIKYEVLPILKEYMKDGILIESKELLAKLESLADKVA